MVAFGIHLVPSELLIKRKRGTMAYFVKQVVGYLAYK